MQEEIKKSSYQELWLERNKQLVHCGKCHKAVDQVRESDGLCGGCD